MFGSAALMLTRLSLGIWVGLVGSLFLAGLSVLNAMPGGKVFVALGDDALRVSAGEVVGGLFRTYYALALTLGLAALAGAGISRAAGRWRGAAFVACVVMIALMVTATALDAFWIYGKVHALAAEIPDDGLSRGSPLYRDFWKWHGISMLLSAGVLTVGVIAGGLACWPQQRHTRPGLS